MSNYNVSDDVQDTFTFEMRGKKYEMRYPRTSEVEEVQTISLELDKAQESKDEKAVKKANDKLEGYLYGFISPVGHELDIKEALKDENIRVMKNFNTMVKTELSIS